MRVWLVLAACASIFSGCRQNATAPAAPVADERKPSSILAALPARPQLMFVSVASDDSHQHLSVASLEGLDRGRYVTPLACDRIYFAGSRGICLATEIDGTSALHLARIFDQQFQPTFRVPLSGPPSRVRISSDGRRAAATVFESGHSYAQQGFSTKTTVIDLSDGRVICDLEEFAVWKDGQRIHAKDFNFWGLTFAEDGNQFYATLETGGISYLVKGDIDRREVQIVRGGVECPSLSPDGAKLVFKKRLGSRSRGWWQLARFDLATNEEKVLDKETQSVDDQVEWLDNQTVMYHLTGSGSAADLWTLAVDGSSEPKLLLREAYSPAVVR
jgi:hypothetical protein